MSMEPTDTPPGQTSFLGMGWSFPPEFARNEQGLLMVADEEDIRSSLRVLFGTVAGERFLRPRYGLDMHELLFEPMSTTTRTYVEDRVRTSILVYEPRIDLLALRLDTSALNEGRVTLVVDYEVRATNSRFNLVYPFYTGDSNEVRGPFGNI
jgi:phage baseplate assembly protein W